MIGRGNRQYRSIGSSEALLLCCAMLQGIVLRAESGVSDRPQHATTVRQSQPAGREALQKAALLVQQGRLEEADQQARLALTDPETKAIAYSVLGAIRLQQRRLDEGASFLQKAIRLEPRLLGAHLNLADVYTRQGKPDLALASFRRVLELDPSNATATSALGAFKQSPDGVLALAADAVKRGDRPAAAEFASDWSRLPHVPAAASVTFALVLTQGGLISEAIEILERAKQSSPPSYELAFNLGGAYLLHGDPARALEAYDLALTIKRDSTQAMQQAAVIAERQHELERSLSYWMRAKKVEPNDPEILLGFGRVCLKMDLLDDAEPALTEAARLKPEDPSYQYTLAVAKVGKRQYEAAQKILEPLVQKQPKDPQLQYALGSVLYVQGRLDEASARLRESVRLQSEQVSSYYYLALVARDQGRDAEAIAILEKLLQGHPEHAASCEVLGGLLMSAQRYDEAERNLRNAVRLNPTSVKANYQLGLLLTRVGKKEEADKQLELTKSLREEDEKSSRSQLRLLDPEQ
jgi:tetratricopeptide (TPR) repeat protein